VKVINRKASFNYNLLERLEVGVVLTGSEAKTLREKGGDLSRSYVKIINHEAFLINANIYTEQGEPSRTRKLLLHKREVTALETKIKTKNLTLVPVKLYNKGRKIKLEIALAKPKRQFEKKEAMKRQSFRREIAQELKKTA